ncbi:hypothetical protein BOW53_02175 [Solemya pervernicosa gill symbiont]|uniref:Methionyl-tRNA formyltransferase n=1 Tax=Solemya pervernicosa gill symbiont TaxID=642797 RepID=A0A1T2L9P4_9GAMM|nr:methionyl-tRNA formyltransferase [Solemya pervernicosa gill symbiont]OOZ41829.1 hypothetical protein BOW53_02175 [Solemya pervernicosa gill symbiont]
MRILFLGNHTVGTTVLRELCGIAGVVVVGVVAHPDDPEDGVRYESVNSLAHELGLPVIRSSGRTTALVDFTELTNPDLIWITDYRYLLPLELLQRARIGAVNLHPSLLPRYRGRAPINWAIIHGESQLGLTAHFVDEGVDCGDVIVQREYSLSQDEDVGDALNRLYPLYAEITREVVGQMLTGRVHADPQDERLATTFPARRPEDGVIEWQQSVETVMNLIRAVAKPYPGAFTMRDGERITVWRAEVYRGAGKLACSAGEVVEILESGPVVCCGKGALILTDIEYLSDNGLLAKGDVLGW